MSQFKKEEEKQDDKSDAEEARNNLLGFFELLLKVDKRINPQNYIKTKKPNIKK